MLGLRQLLSSELLLNASSTITEQICVAASLPSLTQHWHWQLQQTCSMSTAKKAPKVHTKHEKRVANALFCRARVAWRREVKALRKQWYSEYMGRVEARKQSAEEAKQQVAQLRQLRNASKQVDKTMHNLDREIREAERAVIVVSCSAQSAVACRPLCLHQQLMYGHGP